MVNFETSYKLVLFNENQEFCFMQNLAPRKQLGVSYGPTSDMGWTTRSSSWGADPHLTKRSKKL